MATEKRKTLIEQLDASTPPFWVYSQARKYPYGPWAGARIVAKRSGLSRRTVTRIGFRTSWKGLDVDVVSAFLAACGFESKRCPINIKKSNCYKRYCATQAIRPMDHLDDFIWKLFNRSAAKWLKEQDGKG